MISPQYQSTSEEFQLQIDDVYSCGGSCAGCVLTQDERKSRVPALKESVFELLSSRIIEYLPHISDIKSLNITYGIGDHLRMSTDYLSSIYDLAVSCIESRAGLSGSVFISMSLVGREADLKSKLNHLKAIQKPGIPIIPLVVLDPKKLYNKRFSDVYKGLMQEAKQISGIVDLSSNLSDEDCRRISPSEMHEFAVLNGFNDVTLNWVPVQSNLLSTTQDIKGTARWLNSFTDICESSGKVKSTFSPIFQMFAEHLKNEGDISPLEVVDRYVIPLISRQLQIDHTGNVYPKFDGIGDLPQNPRFGFESIGNIVDESIDDIITNNSILIKTRTSSPYLKKSSCMSCEYSKYCALTGFHVYTKNVLAETDGSCPHLGYDILHHSIKI